MSRDGLSFDAGLPAPARVLDPPLPAELLDTTGSPVRVSSRGEPSAPPSLVRSAALPGGGGPVRGWAGPWPQDARWWDPATRNRAARWQLLVRVPHGEVACLVALTTGEARIEAIYD